MQLRLFRRLDHIALKRNRIEDVLPHSHQRRSHQSKAEEKSFRLMLGWRLGSIVLLSFTLWPRRLSRKRRKMARSRHISRRVRYFYVRYFFVSNYLAEKNLCKSPLTRKWMSRAILSFVNACGGVFKTFLFLLSCFQHILLTNLNPTNFTIGIVVFLPNANDTLRNSWLEMKAQRCPLWALRLIVSFFLLPLQQANSRRWNVKKAPSLAERCPLFNAPVWEGCNCDK